MKLIATFRHQIFLVLFLALLSCGTAFSAPLQIAVEDDAGPWSQREGTGFANDVVRAAFKAAGVEAELTVVPYARCKDMVLKGKVAACFSMSWLPEFTGKVVFARKPLFTCYADYFTGSKKNLNVTQENSLPIGTVVGIVSGYEYPPSVYALKEKGVIEFETSESELLNLKKLALGRVDLALVNYNKMKPAEYMLRKAGVADKVKRAFRSGTLDAFIGFSTRHPQGMKALEQFNRGYKIISGNGTRDRIELQWQDYAAREITGLAGKTPQK